MRSGVKVAVLAVFLLAAVITVIVLLAGRPVAERPPPLPIADAANTSSASAPPAAGPASGAAGQTARGLVVSVVGKVGSPGLVTVPEDARVADAVEAAGGAKPGANLLALNLARRLSDGEQIYVGIPAPPGMAPAGGPATGSGGDAGAGALVNLNTATAEQLESLPGVGEVTAQSILDWRTEHGRFSAVEQLREVDGIGEGKLEKLRDEVTVR